MNMSGVEENEKVKFFWDIYVQCDNVIQQQQQQQQQQRLLQTILITVKNLSTQI